MPGEIADTIEATEDDRIEQAESLVRGFCGWHISPTRTETISVRSRRGETLTLPSLHVTAVASVTDDTTPLTVESDYTWSAAGILTRLGYWSDGKLVEVQFTHGYSIPPPELVAVVQAVAKRAVNNPDSLTRRTTGPFTDAYSTTGAGQASTLALLDSEKEILRRYRIPAVA